MPYHVGVLGGGAWGTALANLLATKGDRVCLWAREEEVVRAILQEHENKIFLPGILLHSQLKATSSLQEACENKDLLLSVVPAQFVRSVLTEASAFIDPETPLVSASKGIEISSLKLLRDVFEEVLPGSSRRQLSFLSGPNFAREIAQGLPAGATLASENPSLGKRVQQRMSAPFFKLYFSDDVVGVEVGGAIKNVIAIAAGIVDGLKLGNSLRASMMTRGLNEMNRLGIALGANPLTFLGLSGLGDLILTCTGDLSRNRALGGELALGKTLSEAMEGRKSVVEGVATAEAVHHLAIRHSLDLPICEQVYQILYHQKSCAEAIQSLASRGLKKELEGVE